jgi:putative lipoic acid-binding regulatory protein
MNQNGCKPNICYPCRWCYKVIGRNLQSLHGAIAEAFEGSEYTITSSRSSKGGNYHCLNVEMTVNSESIRLCLYERLRKHPAILMVM